MGNTCCGCEENNKGNNDIFTNTQNMRSEENYRVNVKSGISMYDNPSISHEYLLTIDNEANIRRIILIQSWFRGYRYRISNNQHSKYNDRTNLSGHANTTLYPEVNQTIDYRFKYDFHARVTNINNLEIKPREYQKDNIRRSFPLVEVDKGRKTYEGEWKNRRRDGFGILYWKEGSVFKGFFEKDYANGLGKQNHVGGEIYFGWWIKDKATGLGMFDNTNGCHYEGEWYNDKQSGFGIESWIKGTSYTGMFIEGQKDGIGILTLENGSIYSGNFSKNSIEGIGTFNYSDGKSYSGEWKNNKMHGFGILTYSTDKYYEGQFEEDMKSGFGIYVNSGKVHIGDWIENKLNGEVCIIDNEKGVIRNCLFDHGTKKKYIGRDNKYHSIGETYLKA